jgi:hypothetical protein
MDREVSEVLAPIELDDVEQDDTITAIQMPRRIKIWAY